MLEIFLLALFVHFFLFGSMSLSFGVGCTNAGGSGQYSIFGAFVVFMQFNPQDMWTICSAGKLPSDAKAI